jgi:two-component system, cell cycle response regulator DivK
MTSSNEPFAPVDVLIAEDDETLRRGVRYLLEHQGYTCAEATDGLEAVDLAVRRSPRCLLLDLAMPGLDGFEVARHLRSDPRTRAVHIHCMTGLTGPDVHRQAVAAGCEGFLTKPVAPEILLEAVRGPEPREEARQFSGLTLAEAEELLDWLENHGCTQLEVAIGSEGVTVRCLCPPGFQRGQQE